MVRIQRELSTGLSQKPFYLVLAHCTFQYFFGKTVSVNVAEYFSKPTPIWQTCAWPPFPDGKIAVGVFTLTSTAASAASKVIGNPNYISKRPLELQPEWNPSYSELNSYYQKSLNYEL